MARAASTSSPWMTGSCRATRQDRVHERRLLLRRQARRLRHLRPRADEVPQPNARSGDDAAEHDRPPWIRNRADEPLPGRALPAAARLRPERTGPRQAHDLRERRRRVVHEDAESVSSSQNTTRSATCSPRCAARERLFSTNGNQCGRSRKSLTIYASLRGVYAADVGPARAFPQVGA